jgi:hypothetical protein
MFASLARSLRPDLTFEQYIMISSCIESQFDMLQRDDDRIRNACLEWAHTLFGEPKGETP